MAGTPKRSVLLVQVRQPGDPMIAHEQECIAKRLQNDSISLQFENALADKAQLSWLDGVDAMLIGGSGSYSVHDVRSQQFADPLHQLVSTVLERKIPGFGLCFGHQLLGQHLGSKVETLSRYSEIGSVSYSLTEAGRNDPVFGPLGSTFAAQTGHTDAVTSVPEGVILLAHNECLQTQAFKVADCPFYSTQFHPDLTGYEARARYLALREGLSDINAEATRENVERFVIGNDPTETLLSRFLTVTVGNGEDNK